MKYKAIDLVADNWSAFYLIPAGREAEFQEDCENDPAVPTHSDEFKAKWGQYKTGDPNEVQLYIEAK